MLHSWTSLLPSPRSDSLLVALSALLCLDRPHASTPGTGETHSLHRFMMPVFFFAFNVLLADSDKGSISHESP